jgi:hypothetical protein
MIRFLSFCLLHTAWAQNNQNNNVNFCANVQTTFGLVKSDGTQNRAGACSETIQGAIPPATKMVSTIISTPANGAILGIQEPFTVTVNTVNMQLGFFDDPKTLYYASPQTLNNNLNIQGHQHVTIQQLTSLTQPPDAQQFDFFLGLNDAGGNGVLSANVAKGLPRAGTYRICSITGSRGHQPVVMPVAQRGSQDDCIRVTVSSGRDDQIKNGVNVPRQNVPFNPAPRGRNRRNRRSLKRSAQVQQSSL